MIMHALVLSMITQIGQEAPSYIVPVGASAEFNHLVLDIESKINEGKFLEAEKLSVLLPHNEVTVRIDSSKLNPTLKSDFEDAIIDSATIWEQKLLKAVHFNFINSPKADISISYEPVLAKVAGTDMVAGATWFLAMEPTQPYIEAIFGLKRGARLDPLHAVEVGNESRFTFGRYLGLSPNPVFGSAMGRYDGPVNIPTVVSPLEAGAARKIFALSHLLRQAIHEKKKVPVGVAAVNLEMKSLPFESQLQGDRGTANLLVTNTGSAPLELAVQGDCGCITGTVESPIKPGQSTFVNAVFNTTELIGDVHHNIVISTNDPDHPTVIVPVSITVKPRVEFVFPTSNTIYFDEPSRLFTVYVNATETPVFKIINSALTGADLPMKIDPFQGDVDNYVSPGKKQHVNGYKITIDTSKYPVQALFGRAIGMVYLKTDSSKMSIVRSNIFFQKGIASLPEAVFFGSPIGPDSSSLALTRPGRPFKILKITSESKFLSFEITPDPTAKDTQYFVRINYNGKALGNRFKTVVVVETNDPKQPTIQIPVQTSAI